MLPFQITDLKIDNNPFAKGFRDSGAGKREKKRLALHRPTNGSSAGGRGCSSGCASSSSVLQTARTFSGEEQSGDDSDDPDCAPTRPKRAKSSGSISSLSTAGGELEAELGGAGGTAKSMAMLKQQPGTGTVRGNGIDHPLFRLLLFHSIEEVFISRKKIIAF